MRLQLIQTCSLAIALEGGATSDQTVFPAVAAWLAEDSDHYRAFEAIKGRKSARHYWSLMDFLLCEVCPSERAACFAFYRERGPRLALLRSPRELRYLESRIMLFLTIAYEAYCQKRSLSWRGAVEIVEEICVAA